MSAHLPFPTQAARVVVENLQPHDEHGAELLGTFDALLGRGTVRVRGLRLLSAGDDRARVVLPDAVVVTDAGLLDAITNAAQEAWTAAGEPIA